MNTKSSIFTSGEGFFFHRMNTKSSIFTSGEDFYTPPHFVIYLPVSVRMSVRPSAPVPIDNLSICSRIFFSNFAYILLSGMSGMGLLMG